MTNKCFWHPGIARCEECKHPHFDCKKTDFASIVASKIFIKFWTQCCVQNCHQILDATLDANLKNIFNFRCKNVFLKFNFNFEFRQFELVTIEWQGVKVCEYLYDGVRHSADLHAVQNDGRRCFVSSGFWRWEKVQGEKFVIRAMDIFMTVVTEFRLMSMFFLYCGSKSITVQVTNLSSVNIVYLFHDFIKTNAVLNLDNTVFHFDSEVRLQFKLLS